MIKKKTNRKNTILEEKKKCDRNIREKNVTDKERNERENDRSEKREEKNKENSFQERNEGKQKE